MEERYQNRLIHEKSPYLLQHAHNPVNWYPWGKEAFEAAKATGKPIFLSIGYSTCHWCHVMEKESFQNPEIAMRLNEEFVNIKVDREEHPDVDAVYMSFAQALMSNGAGWPLNVLLTPDLKPFFALTYVPPENQKGTMGLKELIDHISKIWKSEERELIFEQADKIVEIFESSIQTCGDNLPTKEDFLDALEVLFEISDPVNGGFRGAPKFPMGYLYSLFLYYGKSQKESRALFLTELSLNKMHQGGIYDHVGGGFSRYAVDDRWQIPHFEKMLCDNALLCNVFLEAAQCFPKTSVYRESAQEILEYLFTEMRHPDGCFYAAQDADVGGEEGAFYTWTKEEIEKVLSPEESKIFCAYFNVAPSGNFKGRNILSAHLSYEEFIEQIKIPLAQPFESMKELLVESKKKLKEKRSSRPQPFKDDKVITSWNGLMIDCLVKASRVLKEKKYLEAATAAAEFIYKHLWVNNTLLRRYREDDARFKGSLEDYAFLIKGLISLFEAGADVKWLVWASELCKHLERQFKAQGGAFFSTESESGLILRNCVFYDGAEPSGNAVHAENLLRLFQITLEPSCLAQAEDILKATKSFIKEYPQAACYLLHTLGRLHDPKAYTMVIALDETDSLKSEIEALLSIYFVPHLSTIWKKQGDILLEEILPNVKDKVPLDGQTAVYFCSRSGCQAPLIHIEEIEKVIANI